MNSFNRRDLLAGLTGFSLWSVSGCSPEQSHKEVKQLQYDEMDNMRLRPHHIVDIISDHGNSVEYQPHRYGHSLHVVAPQLLSDLNKKIKLVIAADAVCAGCMHLMKDGQCKDVLAQLHPSPSKQAYNDVLDSRLLDHFGIDENSVMTFREYLEIINTNVPGIEKICTHPKENQEERLEGLVQGLTKLGFRKV